MQRVRRAKEKAVAEMLCRAAQNRKRPHKGRLDIRRRHPIQRTADTVIFEKTEY